MSNLTVSNEGRKRRINLYDVIGAPGITPDAVANAIGDITDIDVLEVHINSPGGVAFDGLAIYNLLTQFPGVVNTVVDGIAASAASIIFMAGQQRTISEGGVLMIHGASVQTMGDVGDHRKQIEALDRLNNSIAKVYAKATGGDRDTILELMNEETWMEADEAKVDGYATSVSPSQAVACATAAYMNQYSNIPPQVAAWVGRGTTNTETFTMEDEPVTPEEEQVEDEDTVASLRAELDEMKDRLAKMEEMQPGEEEEEQPEEAKAIATAFAHDKDFVVEMIASGKSLTECYKAYVPYAKNQMVKMAAAADGVDPIKTQPQASADNTEPELVKVFTAASKIKNEIGRNAYLSDRGVHPAQFTAWTQSNA